MNFELTAEGGVRAVQDRDNVLLSKAPKTEQVAFPAPPVFFSEADPFLHLSFYSYVEGRNVIISAGQLEVTLNTGLGGSRAVLDGGIPQATISNLTPGQTGHIVFTYAQALGDAVKTSEAEDFSVDFGDPAGDFAVRWDIGHQDTGKESNTVLQPDMSFGRYGYLFKLEPPAPSDTLFQAVICDVTVSPAGFPVVYPIHVGPLLVPLGYTGVMTGMFIGLND